MKNTHVKIEWNKLSLQIHEVFEDILFIDEGFGYKDKQNHIPTLFST